MKPGRMVPGGMNMQAMMKQAQKMQAEMMKKQQELEEMEYTASAGGGAVSVTVKNKQIASLTIKPEAVDPEDVEMLQDMIVAAVNEAMRAADSDASSTMSKLTGGLNLPF